MPLKFDLISDINAKHGNWSLRVGIVRLWKVTDLNGSKLPYSLELVLIDSEGNKIHATVRKSLIYRYEADLKEGVVYHMTNFGVGTNTGAYRTTKHQFKLSFQYTTKVKKIDDVAMPINVFTFTPPANCFKDTFDCDYLVDLIGVLTGLGREREYEKNGVKTKVVTMELDNNGFRFQITLFGPYVDELNSFVASGDTSNAIVAVLFAKCKDFNGTNVLQNSVKACKLIFNPDHPDAAALRLSRNSANLDSPTLGLSQLQDSPKLQIEEDFLTHTPAITIAMLKDQKEEAIFIVMGKVNCIADEDNWWYSACRCNKKVYADSNMYFCEKCNRHVVNVTYRYRLQLRVIDDTDSATFVLFDREASFLLDSSCADLVESMHALPDNVSVPIVISNLVDKTFLFKVESPRENGARYERSYRVKRVCTDAGIIEKFKEKHTFQDTTTYVEGIQVEETVTTNGVDTAKVAQDLLTKFAEAGSKTAALGSVHEVVDLCNDNQESPSVKKPCPFDGLGLGSSTEYPLNKKIKIEKE